MKSWLKWLISLGHAFVLMVLTAFWMNTDYTYGDEELLVQWSSVLKRVVFNIDEDPPKKDYLFVNLAYEKALIPLESGLGNEVITDRGKLASFFDILKRNQEQVKFTVCDVFLQGTSENDSLLEGSVKGIKNIVFPTHYSDDNTVEALDVNVPHGIADYRITGEGEGFIKFKLFQNDSLSTIPVYMFEKITGRKITGSNGIFWEKSRPVLNSVVIDYQLRSHELFEQSEYPVVNLSELLVLPENVIVNEFLKDRIVLMGDFNNDVHETIFGPMPGTLILLNVYLTLKGNHHLLSLSWIIFIIAGYMIFSRLMLFPENDTEKIRNINWIGPLLGSAIYLSLLSVCSYLLFNIHIQILILALYISLVRYIIRLNQADWNRKQMKEWALELRETYFNFK